jgi:hypothetical protein
VRIVFHADHLAEVLVLLRPYRRRQVSEAERERLAAMGAADRFGPGDGVQSELTAPESTRAAADNPEHGAARERGYCGSGAGRAGGDAITSRRGRHVPSRRRS